jgi:hypothetical protein
MLVLLMKAIAACLWSAMVLTLPLMLLALILRQGDEMLFDVAVAAFRCAALTFFVSYILGLALVMVRAASSSARSQLFSEIYRGGPSYLASRLWNSGREG